jgi:DNA-binding NtrC family response regulator
MLDTIDMAAWPERTYIHDLYMKDERLKRVFIIEDNEMHSMMMDYLLSKDNGFHIFRFKSGEECIKKLDLQPDIIILDYGLPGIDGMETFKQIKKYDPKIPVVVVTENKSNALATQFLARGAYDFILKEPNAFTRVKAAVEAVFLHLSKRKNIADTRRTVIVVGTFIFLVLLSSIISYFAFKH